MTTPPATAVPFNDLARETIQLRPQIEAAIHRVLDSGWFVMGPEHDALEHELSEYLQGVTTALVGNGTDALEIALRALGVGAHSTVLTAANAGAYTTVAAALMGARLLYADVNRDSHLLTLTNVQEAVDKAKTAPDVIVVTHLYGAAAETQQIVEWAHANGMRVLEDCAQALGAVVGETKVGTIGDIATTSFYPTKNLGAIGDGGAVFSSSKDLMSKVKMLRQYGWKTKYSLHEPSGRNSRMDELQAAILRVKLPLLDGWNARRREIHAEYESSVPRAVRLVNRAQPSYVGHLAVAEVADRRAFIKHLGDYGVSTDIHYPIPDHRQAIAAKGIASLPNTEAIVGRIVSIPLFPTMTSHEVSQVSDALRAFS